MRKSRGAIAAAVAGLLLARLAVAACASCPKSSFSSVSRTFPLPDYSPSFAIGDVDGDGRLDAVVAVGTELLFYKGDGQGGFADPVRTPIGATVTEVVLADFRRDGKLDAAVSDGNLVSIWPGDGTGRFGPGGPGVAAGRRLLVADFNGDGIPDLAGFVGDNVVITLGLPSGALAVVSSSPSGIQFPTDMTAGDWNGDGHVDLAVISSVNLGMSAALLLGDGQGGFGAPSILDLRATPQGITSADFDGDGFLDLAIAERTFPADEIAIFRGNATGQFSSPQEFPAPFGCYPGPLISADFNGDGRPDIAAVPYALGPRVVWIWTTDASGGLNPPVSHPLPQVSKIFAGDFNSDGRTDIVALSALPYLSLILSDPSGSLETLPSLPVGFPQAITAADFNHDGNLDLAVTSLDAYRGVTVFLADGAGGFGPPAFYPVESGDQLLSGDFNQDGNPDLLVMTPSGFAILPGTSSGGFGLAMNVALPWSPRRIAVGDFNEDGIPDVVVTRANDDDLFLLLGTGGGRFGAPQLLPAAGVGIKVVDLDADGHLDIVLGASIGVGQITILYGDGRGGFDVPMTLVGGVGFVASIVVADLDADSRLDLAYASSTTGEVIVFPAVAHRAFGGPFAFPGLPFAQTLLAADINGDGLTDLVVLSEAGTMSILVGAGDGTFSLGGAWAVGDEPLSIVSGDWDHDARTDLAIADRDGNAVALLRNTNCLPKHLVVETEPSTCDAAGTPFPVQPVIAVADDGGNAVACATGTVSATLVSGPSGAALTGTLAVPLALGSASFSDLAVTQNGKGYRLGFQLSGVSGVRSVRSRALDVSGGLSVPLASNSGPACPGDLVELSAATVPGASYSWTGPNGFFSSLQNPTLQNVTAAAAGQYTVTARVGDCSSSAATTLIVKTNTASPILTAPATVCPYTAGLTASVPDAGPGAVYAWSITNGVITSGAGTAAVTFKVGPAGSAGLSVTVTASGQCPASASASIAVGSPSCPSPVGFFTVTPCRLLDTRNPAGPLGGPALPAGGDRSFTLTGACGIPAAATALSINVVAVNPGAGPGFLTLFPATTVRPLVSTINYNAGKTRANNAIISLGPSGDVTVHCGQGSGTTDLVIDVNGYFQ